MVAAATFDFWPTWILTVNLAAWSSFQPTFEIGCKYNAKMADLWPKVWFSIWRLPPCWILQDTNFAFKISYGTPFSVPVSNLVCICSKMAELWPMTDFKMVAAAILDFCTMWILIVNMAAGPHFQPMFRIWCKYMQKWPTYGQKCDFQYGGRRHLGICGISILLAKPVTGPHFNSVSVSNLVRIRSKLAELSPFNWFQNGDCHHLGFLAYVNFDGKSGCTTPFTVYVSNSVQIYAKMAYLYGQKSDFQYGGRRHLGFSRISILLVKPVTRPHFLSLCQIWCESVQKWPSYGRLTDFKMATAAILNLLPMTIFVIWSSLGSGWGCFCKIS